MRNVESAKQAPCPHFGVLHMSSGRHGEVNSIVVREANMRNFPQMGWIGSRIAARGWRTNTSRRSDVLAVKWRLSGRFNQIAFSRRHSGYCTCASN